MASRLVIIIENVLYIIAVGLAIAAELNRSVGKVVTDSEKKYEYCEYSSDIATSYGVGACVVLLTSQIIIMVATRCFCCGETLYGSCSRNWAIVFFFFYWVFFLFAELCLLGGSIRNKKMRGIGKPPSCEGFPKGVFALGAFSSTFASIFLQSYYVYYYRALDDN